MGIVLYTVVTVVTKSQQDDSLYFTVLQLPTCNRLPIQEVMMPFKHTTISPDKDVFGYALLRDNGVLFPLVLPHKRNYVVLEKLSLIFPKCFSFEP